MKRLLSFGMILLLSGCSTTPEVISDFCQRYERQVLTRQDVEEIKKLSRGLQSRIQGNEVDYACICLDKDLPICSLK